VLKGDLPAILKKGQLRILVPAQGDKLHRGGNPNGAEQALATPFAQKLGLTPVFVEMADRNDPFKELDEGRADLVAASLSITPERQARVTFSRPVRMVKQQLIARASDDSIKTLQDLDGKEVTVRGTSAYASTLRKLQKTLKNLKVSEPAANEDVYAVLQRVARGELAYTVADNDIVKDARTFEPGFKVALDLDENEPVAWALRKDGSEKLKADADAFLVEAALTGSRDAYEADLDDVKKAGVLRVVTRNTATTYFIYRGEQLGFEYELMRDFAKSLDVRLEVVVAPDREAVGELLAQGQGDVAAAGLTITEERRQRFDFTQPYAHVSELLIVSAADKKVTGLQDTKGRRISVRKSSSYYETLIALQPKYGFELDLVPEEVETETLLDGVNTGKYQATVADSNILDVELTYATRLRSVGPLGDVRDLGWMLRKNQPKLKAALDAYIKKNYQGLFYNMTVNKYFKSPKQMAEANSRERSDVKGKISDWDDLARKYGKAYELDFRLILAQMYQESHFDPKAKSWVGALGLLQVMPATAKDLKVADVTDPDQGVKAGVMLLERYAKLFDSPDIKEKDRLRFALAAYNCGPGHVFDARRLAEDLKLDPNKWFKNVEVAMMELMKPDVARHARHGYFRATETVAYVSEIQTRYDSYARLVELDAPAP
jgi:membrane-bound lytic murein transglycosylase F